jgi:hypothetical protein
VENTIERIYNFWYPRKDDKIEHPKPILVNPVCAICFDTLKNNVCFPCGVALYEDKVNISEFLQACRCRALKEEEEKCARRRRQKLVASVRACART